MQITQNQVLVLFGIWVGFVTHGPKHFYIRECKFKETCHAHGEEVVKSIKLLRSWNSVKGEE